MITHYKLNIFVRYGYMIDIWLRTGSPDERTFMSDKDWNAIYLYIDNLNLIKKGLQAEPFLRKSESEILSDCENKDVFNRLQIIAHNYEKDYNKKNWIDRVLDFIFK
jgi:hypothetical protein